MIDYDEPSGEAFEMALLKLNYEDITKENYTEVFNTACDIEYEKSIMKTEVLMEGDR